MQRLTLPRPMRPASLVLALMLTATLIAACGGGSAAAPTGDTAPSQPTQQATPEGSPASTMPAATDGATDSGAAPVPASMVQAALGETPTPECDTSLLSGSVSCVWTAADGAWLKVEDGTPQEMPDLDSFTQRVTGTLGLDDPVAGLGEAAYVGVSPRGTRIAVYLGEGRVLWVVLNEPGDSTELVTEIATELVAGM